MNDVLNLENFVFAEDEKMKSELIIKLQLYNFVKIDIDVKV